MLSGWLHVGWPPKERAVQTAVTRVRSRTSALSWLCKRPTPVPMAMHLPAMRASILTVWCHHATIRSTNPNRYRKDIFYFDLQRTHLVDVISGGYSRVSIDLIYYVWHLTYQLR